MDYEETHLEARILVRKGEHDAALELYEGLIAEFPDKVELFHERANVWYVKGDLAKAVEDNTREIALSEGEDLVNALSVRAARYDMLERYDEAAADYTRLMELESGEIHWVTRRGVAYFDKGDLDAALADLERAIEKEEKPWWALVHRGWIRGWRGDLEGAIADFTRTLSYRPDYAYALGQRGYCRFTSGDQEGAEVDFSAALELDPKDAWLWYSRGVCRWNRVKEYEEAAAPAKDFSKAIELDPNMTDAYLGRGNAYYVEAVEKMEWMKGIVMEAAKDEAERLLLMEQLAHIGYPELIPRYNQTLVALRSQRTELDKMILSASAMMAEDYVRDAMADLNRALELDPASVKAYYFRGCCYELVGDREKAAADFRQTLALNPGHPHAGQKLSELCG